MTISATQHSIRFADSSSLSELEDETVDLMVTSPPYPMIEMWDGLFGELNSEIEGLLENRKGKEAFEAMHTVLDAVWDEVYRTMKAGGIACINIGDATRSIGGVFRLYSSHARIISHCVDTGFDILPGIIWRKPTNSPTKFMGSGMLPNGAYVTLEHENIIIMRKGQGEKSSKGEDRLLRRESAYFWEERNEWFSDLWTSLPGIRQEILPGKSRRSAAFPFELAYRLINMFSLKGGVVLDPFLGTGTTVLAAIASARNSFGFEYDRSLSETIDSAIMNSMNEISSYLKKRLERHRKFMIDREMKGPKKSYSNETLKMNVVTGQEKDVKFQCVNSIEKNNFEYTVHYGRCEET